MDRTIPLRNPSPRNTAVNVSSVSSTETEFLSPLKAELTTNARILSGAESELVLRVSSSIDLSMLRLELQLPAELQRTSGPDQIVIGSHAAGATAELRCHVLASSLAEPIIVIGRGVSTQGHASAILEVAP